MENRLIGRRFLGNLGPLSGFGKVLIFVSFEDLGKMGKPNAMIKLFVRCTSGLL
jgi:hypothetical protein